MELKAQAAKPVELQVYLKLFGWLYSGSIGGFTYGQKAVQRMENIVVKSQKVGAPGCPCSTSRFSHTHRGLNRQNS